jgi:hypothetical protein
MGAKNTVKRGWPTIAFFWLLKNQNKLILNILFIDTLKLNINLCSFLLSLFVTIAKPLLQKAIESVLNQDYPNIEYIVIDGNSTDGTVDIIESYSSKITTYLQNR